MTRDNYDRIADFYDVDMGRNMAFDDVAFYRAMCAGRARALELGCGNGRILLDLGANVRDTVGVDRSLRMLQGLRRKCAARGRTAPLLARMDIRSLAFAPAFDLVLCPYSLATYLLTDADFAHMAEGVRSALLAKGELVIDAFIPRPVTTNAEFTLDYRRRYADGELVRWKRISRADDERNRIERRYERCAPDGTLLETIEVAEVIRPLAPAKLGALLAANGFDVTREWWDYGEGDPATAQFYAVAAAAR